LKNQSFRNHKLNSKHPTLLNFVSKKFLKAEMSGICCEPDTQPYSTLEGGGMISHAQDQHKDVYSSP
jgi:hypothetical protein